jgi:tetratricopeptide (TPR) repeat protein
LNLKAIIAALVAFSMSACISNPPRDSQMIGEGRNALASGRYVEAEQTFRELLKRQPLNWDAHLNLGIALNKQNRPYEALPYLIEADRIIPQASPTLLWLADTWKKLGLYQECQDVAMRWSVTDPKSYNALDYLGNCAGAAGDYTVAVNAFKQAITLHDSAAFEQGLAKAALYKGDYMLAREAARRGLRFNDPNYNESLKHDLMWSELALGNLVEAHRLYVERPILGISIDSANDGWQIKHIIPHSPADHAGLKVGDVLTRFNNQSFQNGQPAFAELVKKEGLGAQIALVVRRGNEDLHKTVVLALELPGNSQAITSSEQSKLSHQLTLHGIRVEPARIPQGQPFNIVIELTARSHESGNIPVTAAIQILQNGRSLTSDDVEAVIPLQRRWQITKEVLRAAGTPGLYQVSVGLNTPSSTISGSTQFEIVP